jgi:hypothetical protein
MDAFTRPDPVRLEVSPERLVVIPGGQTALNVAVTNRADATADFDLILTGVPIHWTGGPLAMINVQPGERREARLTVRVPPFPAGRPGMHLLALRTVRRGAPPAFVEAAIPLVVAVFELEGRVGVLMEATRFAVQPGDTLEIPVQLSNHGLASDTFTAAVEGLPPSWVISPMPQATLNAGEQVEMSFAIRAPHGTAIEAGPLPFSVRVASRESPSQQTVVACALDVPEMHQFGAQLLPTQVTAGQSAAVKVQNRGNAPAVYSITWECDDNTIRFSPPGPWQVEVAAGQTARQVFLPGLRRRPIFGGSRRYPYTVRVESAEETHRVAGEVETKGLLPPWLGTAALFATIFAALMFLLVQWAISQPAVTTPTPPITPPPATPTIPPGLTPVG